MQREFSTWSKKKKPRQGCQVEENEWISKGKEAKWETVVQTVQQVTHKAISSGHLTIKATWTVINAI